MTARVAAARAIAEAVTMARPLDERLAADLSLRDPRIDPRDRALARSIATVALRRLGTIRKAIAQRLEKGMPRRCGTLEWTLVVGAAQLLFLETPDHAAVDLAVQSRSRRRWQRAVRRVGQRRAAPVARDRATILAASDPLDDDTPHWLAARWRATYGDATARAIAAAHRCEPTLDLSVKSDPAGWAERLGGVVLPSGSVRLDSHLPGHGARRLRGGRMVGAGRRRGAAGAAPRCALGPTRRRPMRRAGRQERRTGCGGRPVTTVDRSAERLKVLAANFERLKLHADIVVADALAFDAGPFDAALVDAPCTATGTIRRHPDVAWLKRPTDLPASSSCKANSWTRPSP